MSAVPAFNAATFFPVGCDRYRVLKLLGSGAYGVVAACEDMRTGESVAVKKVPSYLSDVTDAKRVLREVKLMRHLSGSQRILGLVGLEGSGGGYATPGLYLMVAAAPVPALASERASIEDVYIVSALMDTDLHKVCYTKQKLTLSHAVFWMYQTLAALKTLHSASILHRDLKPSNLLLNADCSLRVCDLGLARGVDPASPASQLTEYVVTRWYRAPEIMLGQRNYGPGVDVWALGAIFAEVLRRAPLWSGRDFGDQLKLIFSALGTPPEEELTFVKSERALAYIRTKLSGRSRQTWAALGLSAQPSSDPTAHALALDLLGKMLTIDPRKRISVDDALSHSVFSSIRNESTEERAATFDFSFENQTFLRSDVQRLMYEEMLRGPVGAAAAPSSAALPPPPPAKRPTQQYTSAADVRDTRAPIAAPLFGSIGGGQGFTLVSRSAVAAARSSSSSRPSAASPAVLASPLSARSVCSENERRGAGPQAHKGGGGAAHGSSTGRPPVLPTRVLPARALPARALPPHRRGSFEAVLRSTRPPQVPRRALFSPPARTALSAAPPHDSPTISTTASSAPPPSEDAAPNPQPLSYWSNWVSSLFPRRSPNV